MHERTVRVVSANILCLNLRPAAAIAAVAAQDADVVVLIESVKRFERHAARHLPPLRARGYTRAGGMPVTLHAGAHIPVDQLREESHGWLEARVGGLTLMAVHAVAPYLPWRWPKRTSQLMTLAGRMNAFDTEAPGLVIGDFNTADFEPAWTRYEDAAAPWRRIDCADHGPGPGPARGTWPLGQTWSPIALDHALATPGLADAATVRTFPIPGSDHLGLVTDLPASAVGIGASVGAGIDAAAPERSLRAS